MKAINHVKKWDNIYFINFYKFMQYIFNLVDIYVNTYFWLSGGKSYWQNELANSNNKQITSEIYIS
jgi:hypothetical protein